MDNTLRNVLFMSNSGHVGIKTSNPQAILHLHDPQVLLPQKGVEDSTGTDRSIAKILQITNGNNSGEGFTIHRDASYGPATLFFKQHDLIPLIIEGPSGGLSIAPDGKIGIGTYNPQAKLDVNGSFKAASATIAGTLSANELRAPSAKVSGLICAEEIRVQLSGNECWPDYVFSKDYKLLPLHDVEEYITENQHLPNIPSSAEVESNGVELGAINALLLQKVEELTLYIIQMEKRLVELENK